MQLTNVLLTDGSGGSSVPQIENAEITEPPQLPEDVNQDGVVNIIDLTLVASSFGATGENTADVNQDGVVNIIDLTLVAAAFGNTAARTGNMESQTRFRDNKDTSPAMAKSSTTVEPNRPHFPIWY